MLTFHGQTIRHGDGASRRSFLRAGALGLGGLTLADMLRGEAQAGVRSSRKAVILLHLDGGPPQMDLIDPKPEAPKEIRGEFKSLPSKIPGLHLTELMPQIAAHADRFIFLRSLVGADGQHDAFQCQSGFTSKELAAIGGHPALGSAITKLLGRSQDAAPSFVDLMQGRPLVRNSARAGYLGPACAPFRPELSHLFERQLEPGMQTELARQRAGHTLQLELTEGLSADRLEHRVELLARFDRLRRDLDGSGAMNALDQFTQQAVGILTSGRFAAALDLAKEDPRVIERYTPRVSGPAVRDYTTEGPKALQKLLLARRLVEAGVRCVSVSLSDFDTHSNNFDRMRYLGPLLDHGLHTLVEDLRERRMLDDVLVLAWGEFGRTPKVNGSAGRDHWPRVSMGLMAGGGLKTGQVIGKTDKWASEATARPVHYQDVIATLYHHLGIDPHQVTLNDITGRPQHLVSTGRVISEVV